jgi:methyl-accepting chemotaxis protein
MSRQKATPSRRRTIYIQRKFQLNFIIRFCFVAFGSMLLTSGILYFLTKDTLTTTFLSNQRLAIQETSRVILPDLIITNLIVLACFVIATVVLTLYMSHRISGPLHRIEEIIDSVGHGNLKVQVELRDDDQIKGLGVKINLMIHGLGQRVLQIRNEIEKLRHISQTSDWNKDEAKEEIDKLAQTVNQLFHTN